MFTSEGQTNVMSESDRKIVHSGFIVECGGLTTIESIQPGNTGFQRIVLTAEYSVLPVP